jgi:hypothetical protein
MECVETASRFSNRFQLKPSAEKRSMYYFFYGFLRVRKVLGRTVNSILAYFLSILAGQAQLVIRILFISSSAFELYPFKLAGYRA